MKLHNIKVCQPAYDRIKELAKLNDCDTADIIDMFMEFEDEVVKTYELVQWDFQKKEVNDGFYHDSGCDNVKWNKKGFCL